MVDLEGVQEETSAAQQFVERAAQFAQQSPSNRSELYAKAVEAYVDAHTPDAITESWNAMLAEITPEELEEDLKVVRAAARQTMKRKPVVTTKVAQGDVYWYDFAEPRGSEPGSERPVAILQGDALNRTTIRTAVVIVLTSNVRAASATGNVLLTKKDTGLERDSVANVSQLATIDRAFLRNHAGRLPPSKIQAILRGVDTMLGR